MPKETSTRFSPDAGACEITLNRPAKLNALNLDMIRCLHRALDQVDEKAGKVGCLIMAGSGGKSFCAGGDVQMIREEGLRGGSLPADFFFEEYGVMFRLATLFERTGCCQVSLLDGITMGGGVGLSTHGPFRIVTEKTRFAMPEMAIGLFPDVGATHLLSHLKAGSNVGRFLAMTGTNLAAWDCLRAGVGTHFVPSSCVPKLRKALLSRFKSKLIGQEAMKLCQEIIKEIAAGRQASSADCVLADDNVEVINRCFSAPSVEEIISRLKTETGDFALLTLQKMFQSCSPTSCKVTLRAMKQAATMSIGPVLQIEYRLSQRFTTRPQPMSDFFEGIRAVLVEKDRRQKWNPSWDALHEITEEKVDMFFSPLEEGHRCGELPTEDLWAFCQEKRAPFREVELKSKL